MYFKILKPIKMKDFKILGSELGRYPENDHPRP